MILFFILNYYSGFFCGVCPIYLSEIAPISTRGLIGTVNALAMCIGNLVTNILGLPTVLGSDTLWPLLLALIVIPAAVHVVGLPFCVESPKYLYIVKRDESKAKQGNYFNLIICDHNLFFYFISYFLFFLSFG